MSGARLFRQTKRNTRIKAVTVILSLVLMSILLPFAAEQSHAADEVGKLNDRTYTDFNSLVNDLKNNYVNKTVTIKMSRDWDAAQSSAFDKQLVIPSGCRATLDMQGHLFNRNRAVSNNWGSNGGLIKLESSALLTINGGEKTAHSVKVYSSTDRSKKAGTSYEAEGGTLAGGASTNGSGGIQLQGRNTLTLNDVTIAGCRAEQKVLSDGYGGGLLVRGATNVRINDSVITGCFAYNDGGGIHVGTVPDVRIEITSSRIEKNYAHNKGGGFSTSGEHIYLAGDGKSVITANKCEDSGGGVAIREGNSSVSGFNISDNQAKTGGGVFVNGKTVSLAGLTVKNNSASERGGGVFISSSHNTISSCEITDNSAGNYGGGVCVAAGVKDEFAVTESTIIRNNRKGNLFIADTNPENSRVNFSLTHGADVHMSYSDTKGKDSIMVTQGSVGDTIKSPNCIQYLTADNNGYHFSFNAKPNQRKIYYVKDGKDSDATGSAATKPGIPENVTPAQANNASSKDGDSNKTAGVVGTTGLGGYSKTGDYDLVRGFFRHQITESDTEDKDGVFYYSDAFFDADPEIYNENLATASLVMAYTAGYLRAFEDEDATGNEYYNKHAAARQFMADIGCPDQNIYVNDFMVAKPETDSIGVAIGSKKLVKSGGVETGYTLVPIAVRGAGYESEWASNMTLGTAEDMAPSKEAKGFSSAATEVMAEIEHYINIYDLDDEIEAGSVKFWITGFSRGGATANITAKRLIEQYASGEEGKQNQVFAYPAEAPKGGTDAAEKLSDKSRYFSIHNMINAADVVPLVAPENMGFKRYGVDHYIPGSPAPDNPAGSNYSQHILNPGSGLTTVRQVSGAGAEGSQTVTTYRDNDPYYIKGGGQAQYHNNAGKPSDNMKNEMMAQLRTIDSSIVFDDYFHPMALDFVPGVKIYENGAYDGNHEEEFISDFIRFAQEGIGPEYSSYDWSKALKDRDMFAKDLQEALRDTMSLVFTMSSDDAAGFVGRASTIVDRIDLIDPFGNDTTLFSIYSDVIQNWHSLSDSRKEHYITFFWDRIEMSGAFDYLSKSEKSKLEKNWPVLANFIFTLVETDYNYTPGNSGKSKGWANGSNETMMLIPTFATYADYILKNHYPEVDMAWARTYETNNYYKNESKEYAVKTDGYGVDMPKAAAASPDTSSGAEISEGEELVEGKDNNNVLEGDQRIILEVDNVVGEAIYYDLINNETKSELETNRIYRGGIDLSLGSNPERDYTIRTYAISYGVRSELAVYNIRLTSDRHKVTVDDGSGADPVTDVAREGYTETIAANPADGKYLDKWTIRLNDGNGNAVDEDIADILLGDNVNSESAAFVMPEAGAQYGSGKTYPAGYALEVTAICKDRINGIDSSPEAPKEGEMLPEAAAVTLSTAAGDSWTPSDESGNPIEYPISWVRTYEKDGQTVTVPASGQAYKDTQYIATITIPADQAAGIVFNPTGDTLKGTTSTGTDVLSVTRDEASGDATIVIAFAKTGDDGGESAPEADIQLTVKVYDLNLEAYVDGESVDYHVLRGTEVMLTAPDAADESFTKWELEGSGLELADGYSETDRTIKVKIPQSLPGTPITIDAQYKPIIGSIKVTIDPPEGGKVMQTDATDEAGKETVKVTISDEYLIKPEYINISWSPEPSVGEGSSMIAEYLTPYTVTVTIVPKKDEDDKEYIEVKGPDDDDYVTSAMKYVFADDLDVTVNGAKAGCDKAGNSVTYTFPATKYTYDYVVQPGETVYLSHGASVDEIKSRMPKTATIVTKEGRRFTVELGDDWDISYPISPDDRRGQWVLLVSQAVDLPYGVDNPDIDDTNVIVVVSIDEAQHASSPEATLDSGKYLYDQQAELITREKDGTTYYTTDGSDPRTSSTRKAYSGEPIYISRSDLPAGENAIVLKAYTTVGEDKWDSSVVTYEYVFDNEVPVPKGEELVYNTEPQIGLSSDLFYTIEAEPDSGVSIDADGNASAVNAGTYDVKLKIREGFVWKIENDSDDAEDYTTTEDDQTVTFNIAPADISTVASVSADGRFKVLDDLKKALRITSVDGRTLAEGEDYTVSYGEVKNGKVTVTVAGKGNYTGTITSTFIIGEDNPDKKLYTITLDLNGGELNGVTGTISEQYYEGETITLPKPSRKGYVFDYWKGSKYKAGQKYKVHEDHTFTAQWEKFGTGSGTGNGTRTGDETHLLLLFTLMTMSLLALLSAIVFRGRKQEQTDK